VIEVCGAGFVIEACGKSIIEVSGPSSIIEVCGPGPRGAAGPQGPAGLPGTGTFSMQAATGGISALRVIVGEGGIGRYPDINNADDAGRVVGVSYTAAIEGATFVAQSDGLIEDSFWTWQPGPVWCGIDGQLTQSLPPSPAWVMEIGRSRNTTSLLLDIQAPIIRN
jgi:hypothetical protein